MIEWNNMRPIFNSHNSDINKNAYMNWRTNPRCQVDNLCVLADGYYETAKLIVERILCNNSGKIADALVYPMIFNFNHSIELYLKSIQWRLNNLLDKTDKFENGHNLIGLYGKMITLIGDFETKHSDYKLDDFKNIMYEVKSYIDELKEVVPEGDWRSMDFPRYPMMSDKKTAHFYVADKNNVTIDVEYFRERLENIHDALDNLNNTLIGIQGLE